MAVGNPVSRATAERAYPWLVAWLNRRFEVELTEDEVKLLLKDIGKTECDGVCTMRWKRALDGAGLFAMPPPPEELTYPYSEGLGLSLAHHRPLTNDRYVLPEDMGPWNELVHKMKKEKDHEVNEDLANSQSGLVVPWLFKSDCE